MPKRILLADDSITIQKVVELTFSDGDYEVVAVNNGAKAIQKLSEMRPDIILSDIIMPEKNGYEVCEFVKSHPEFRNIPVVLLTGTFEPFDPDRADKAGCDAVVTKPFESQSLIQRVEELIQQARATATAAKAAAPAPEPAAASSTPAPAPEPEATPWDEPATPSFTPSSSFSTAAMPAADPFSSSFATNDNDIFGTSHPATTEMPFDAPEPFGGETRAFPRMSFDELQQMAAAPVETAEATPSATAAPEPVGAPPEAHSQPEPASPWDVPADPESPAYGGETRAFPRMSFDELQAMQSAPTAPPEPEPLGEPEPPAYGGETRAFPRMSFDELQAMQSAPPAAAEPESRHEPASPWDEPGEERAYEPAAPAAAAPEPPSYGGETRAFPSMSFDELQSLQRTPEPASPWDEPAPASTHAPVDAAPEPIAATHEAMPEPSSPWDEPAEPAAEPEQESPFAAAPSAFHEEPAFEEPPASAFHEQPAFEEQSAFGESAHHEPAASDETAEYHAHTAFDETAAFAPPHEPELQPVAAEPEPQQPAAAAAAAVTTEVSGELTEEQVERIARRVVQLMSEQVVRNIAWEVIPDMAEIAVKARIRELEAEA